MSDIETITIDANRPAPALPWYGLRPFERRVLVLIGDAAAAEAAAVLALWLWTFTSGAVFSTTYLLAHPLILFGLMPGWVLLLNLDRYDYRAGSAWQTALRHLLRTAGLTFVLYLGLYFLTTHGQLPRLVVLYFIAGALILGLSWRRIYVTIFTSSRFRRQVVVVGAGWAGRTIVEALAQNRPGQYAVVGLFDDDASKHGLSVLGVSVLGGHECLLPVVQRQRVSEVILAVTGDLPGATIKALLDCQALGAAVVPMLPLYEQITGNVPIEHLDVESVLAASIDRGTLDLWSRMAQRMMDDIWAALGLVFLAPIFPVIALAIWLEDRGPILIWQTRLGKGGQPFEMAKFRTMVRDAEADGHPRWAVPDDERITRVGRFLRRSRLDETPQFWNVLKGEMRLVGPRPERPEFVAELEKQIPFFRARLGVEPGITGWAQVHYGYSATVADAACKLQWDLYYLKHQSLWLDLLILVKTVGVILRFSGT